MVDPELPDTIRDATREAWQRYLDLLTPLRPDLHRFCRRLTGELWDAEDLVQDTLLRGFATLGFVHHRIDNPRAYLMRIAANLWIDKVRHRETESATIAAHHGSALSSMVSNACRRGQPSEAYGLWRGRPSDVWEPRWLWLPGEVCEPW